jgi:hypothetical protein
MAMLYEPVDENGALRGYKNPLIPLSARADLTIGIFANLDEASDIRVYHHFSSLPEKNGVRVEFLSTDAKSFAEIRL